jgi:hypothetical protein
MFFHPSGPHIQGRSLGLSVLMTPFSPFTKGHQFCRPMSQLKKALLNVTDKLSSKHKVSWTLEQTHHRTPNARMLEGRTYQFSQQMHQH